MQCFKCARLMSWVARWICLTLLAGSAGSFGLIEAADDRRVALDESTQARCLEVLRAGLRGDEFWPSMHAAEGLTLAGHGPEVVEFLTPRVGKESDDQRRCGLAREIARAGDRSTVSVLLSILAGENPHGHVHAAESLFKIDEVGDGLSLNQAVHSSDNVALRVMASAALARHGDVDALQVLRDLLKHENTKHASIAAWSIGQLGDASDIPRLQTQLSRLTEPSDRANFQHALALLGDEGGLAAMTENLSSADNSVRTYAANFAGDARLLSAGVRLMELLDDQVTDVRIRAAQSLVTLASPIPLRYRGQAEPMLQVLEPGFCWFHPRAAALPGAGQNGQPAVVVTIQKHLVASDHFSGLCYMRSDDLGRTWTGPTEVPELAWRSGPKGETIGVCDVTPGWVAHSKKLLAIGIQLRYSAEGVELLDQPRSHAAAYAIYDPTTGAWAPWQTLAMPEETGKFYLVAPGCGQWLEKPDGTLLVPAYVRRPEGGRYTTTILHCAFDGQKMTFLESGDEMTIPTGRGLYEPSLIWFDDQYYLTIRSDDAAYVTTSQDGLHYHPVRPWTFDDDRDLGSYNTQAHWLSHSEGLFLCYTRRGANNDHIVRNRAPIFIAQVDPVKLQVLRHTERSLLPERGAMLGNFGAASITPNESWVTDSEYIEGGKAHPRGADGTTWLGRVKWSRPNQLIP